MSLRRWLGLALGPLLALALILLRLSDPAPISALRHAGFDMLQQIWPRVSPPEPVRIADIDEVSLRKLGQWPWPRDRLATLVTTLKDLGAAAIVFDIVFPEPDRMSPKGDNDQAFAAAIKDAPVVLAQAATTDAASEPNLIPKYGFAQTGLDASGAPPEAPSLVTNLVALDMAAKGLGLINIDLAEGGGVARDLPLMWGGGKPFYPSLALEALRVAQGEETYVVNNSPSLANAINSVRVGALEIPTTEQGGITVYYARPDPYLFVSVAKLFDPETAKDLAPQIQGNIVLIGASATGLLDTRISALGQALPGVAVHAQALQQIMAGQFLSRPQWTTQLEILSVLIASLLFSVLSLRARPMGLLASLLIIVALMAAATLISFRTAGLLLDTSFPVAAAILCFAATLSYKLLVTDAQGRMLRRAFGHYVSPHLLTEIERHPQALKLGGETREVTVLFADIKNFTPLSQKLSPPELVTVVNAILTAVTDAVLSEDGTLDKYIGDAVMAFWNAPVAVPEHQYRACLAALKAQHAVATLNEDEAFSAPLKAKGLWPIGIRIGLASGPATVGNMGSATRFDYSVLGETVNIAARAESSCKHVEADILLAGAMTEATQSLAGLDAGKLLLKGVDGRVPCHAIFAATADKRFHEARKSFENRTLSAHIQAPYERFLARLADRSADYS